MADGMNTFQDAIAEALALSWWEMSGGDANDYTPSANSGDLQLAWTVLAMPEMEAIRKALAEVAESDRYAWGGVTPPAEALRDIHHLPDSVIEWCLNPQEQT